VPAVTDFYSANQKTQCAFSCGISTVGRPHETMSELRLPSLKLFKWENLRVHRIMRYRLGSSSYSLPKPHHSFWTHRIRKLGKWFKFYKTWDSNTNKTGSTTLKEWTTPDSRNTPSITNLEEEETVGVPGNDGNASMPEQVKRPNPWMMMMMI